LQLFRRERAEVVRTGCWRCCYNDRRIHRERRSAGKTRVLQLHLRLERVCARRETRERDRACETCSRRLAIDGSKVEARQLFAVIIAYDANQLTGHRLCSARIHLEIKPEL